MKHHTILLFFILLFCAGCNGNVRLSGKVTFSDDGSPVYPCTVVFTQGNFVAQGNQMDPDGTYVVGSLEVNDGLPKGEYQVHITGAEDARLNRDGTNTYTSRIDSKYRNPETSGLKFTVDGKTHTFDIQLDRAR